LFVFVFALYLPSVGNGFIYDDHQLILEQPMPQSFAEIFRVFGERHWYNLPYYRPLVRFTMVAQKYLHGDRAVYFHLFNVFLVSLVALMSYLLLRLPVFKIKAAAALIAAAVFAAHPVASSCVYPICSGRETLIPAFFIIASVYAFLRRGKGWYVLAMLFFAASLFSKEQAIIVPALFVLADLLGVTSNPPGREISRWVRRYVPAVIILAAYFVIRVSLFGGGAEHHIAIFTRPYGPLLSLLYAIQTTFVPFVELVYEPSLQIWLSLWRLVVSLAVIFAVVVFIQRCRCEIRRLAYFWLGWILLALLPTANILLQETAFAERYGFVALLGAVAIISATVPGFGDTAAARRLGLCAGIVLLVICSAITLNRCRFFRNDLAFLGQWLKVEPYLPQAHASIALVFFNQKEFDRAIEHYQKALKFGPDKANTRSNLAIALVSRGRIDEAIVQFERVVQLEPKRAKAYKDLAGAFQLKGDIEQAERYFGRYLELSPADARIHNKLAGLLAAGRNTKEAIRHFREAIRTEPDWAEPLNSLAWVLATQPDIPQAERAEAVAFAERAVELSGGKDPSALDTLAAAYATAGNFEKAVETAQKAIDLAAAQKAEQTVEQIRRRMELYKQARPYRERPGR